MACLDGYFVWFVLYQVLPVGTLGYIQRYPCVSRRELTREGKSLPIKTRLEESLERHENCTQMGWETAFQLIAELNTHRTPEGGNRRRTTACVCVPLIDNRGGTGVNHSGSFDASKLKLWR